MGLFYLFFDDVGVQIVGVEVVGYGIDIGKYVVSLNGGVFGVLYGNCIFLLQDVDGQIIDVYFIFVGFDYFGIGLEYVWLYDIGCVEYILIIDDEVLEVFYICCCFEGIILVLESFYVLVEVFKCVFSLFKEYIMVVNLFGCGDKDMQIVMYYM